jgi:uncharacterized small protein (DUF1192 family)
MAIELDDLEPRPKKVDFGAEDLSTWSLENLAERIVALETEIERCRALMASKQDSRAAADSVFKKP